jgi:hypothetical protein
MADGLNHPQQLRFSPNARHFCDEPYDSRHLTPEP